MCTMVARDDAGGEAIGPSWGDVKGNLISLALGALVWFVATPPLAACEQLEWTWIAFVLLRTFTFGCVVYGGMHHLM